MPESPIQFARRKFPHLVPRIYTVYQGVCDRGRCNSLADLLKRAAVYDRWMAWVKRRQADELAK